MANNEKTYLGPITNITDNGKDYYISLENIPEIQTKIGEIIDSLAVKDAAEDKPDTAKHAVYTVDAKNHLETLYASLTADDENNVIDTLKEILAFFNNTEEGKTLVSFIAGLTDTLTGEPAASKTITAFDEVDGKVSATFENISIDSSQINDKTNSYSSTGEVVVTGKAIKNAIDSLTDTLTGAPSTSKTITAFDEVGGKVSATFSNISIASSQVNDKAGTTYDPTNATNKIKVATSETIKAAINYTNSNGTTVAVGGIEKGTTFSDKSVVDILEKMLYPYVAFDFTSFTTNPAATTYEFGASKTITAVTPSFELGSRPLTSVKVGSTPEGNDYFSGTTATSGTAITLTNPPTIPGTANVTLYMTISDYNAEKDENTTTTKSVEFKFAKYYYYTVTSNTTMPTTATAIGTGSQKDIPTQNGQYIWFLSPTAKTKIQQYAMNQWNDMTTSSVGTIQFTTQTGQTLTYYVYRTPEMTAATGTYRLA